MPSRLAEHCGYLRIGRRRHGNAVVSEATDLDIDGFTRSASTFAVVAFQLLEHRAGMVVAAFDEVTGHLDRTIERLNARFGTDFTEFVHTDEHVRECFDLIEMRARRPPWKQTIQDFLSGLVPLSALEQAATSHRGEMPAVPEHRAQRPSAYKEERKNALRDAYHSPAHTPARRRAEELHALFTD